MAGPLDQLIERLEDHDVLMERQAAQSKRDFERSAAALAFLTGEGAPVIEEIVRAVDGRISSMRRPRRLFFRDSVRGDARVYEIRLLAAAVPGVYDAEDYCLSFRIDTRPGSSLGFQPSWDSSSGTAGSRFHVRDVEDRAKLESFVLSRISVLLGLRDESMLAAMAGTVRSGGA